MLPPLFGQFSPSPMPVNRANDSVRFGKIPSRREMRGYTRAINQVYYDVLGKKDVSMVIHGQSIPDAEKGVYGSPYSASARQLMAFLKQNGIHTMQLGPGGPNLSPLLPSPYETSSLLLNPLFIPFEELTTRRWGKLLDKKELQARMRAYPVQGEQRRNYKHHLATTQNLTEQAYETFKQRLARPNLLKPRQTMAVRKLNREFEALKQQNKAIWDKVALYEVLSKKHQCDFWPLWGHKDGEFGDFIKLMAPSHVEVPAGFLFFEQLLGHRDTRGLGELAQTVDDLTEIGSTGIYGPALEILKAPVHQNGGTVPRWNLLQTQGGDFLRDTARALTELRQVAGQNPVQLQEMAKSPEHPHYGLAQLVLETATDVRKTPLQAIELMREKVAFLLGALNRLADLPNRPGLEEFIAQRDFDKQLYAGKDTEEAQAAVQSRIEELTRDHAETVEKFKFTQFLAEKAHGEMLTTAKKMGMRIMGDLPVSYAPVEVWMQPEAFCETFRLGAPPGRSVPDHGQSWMFYTMRNPREADGGLSLSGRVFQDKIRRLKDLYPGGLRVDHGNGYIDPWVFHLGEVADPASRPHKTAFRLHSAPHLVDLLSLVDPAQAVKLWTDRDRPALLGLDRPDTQDTEFVDRLTSALGFTPEQATENPQAVAEKLSGVLCKVFTLTPARGESLRQTILPETYISTHELNGKALAQYREAVLKVVEDCSQEPFNDFMRESDFYKRNPIYVGWESAIESIKPEQVEKYGGVLKLLIDILREKPDGKASKTDTTDEGAKPLLFVEDLGNVTLPISEVMEKFSLTGMSTLMRYDAKNPLGKADRFYPANHPARNIAMIGSHDHPPLAVWAEQKVFTKPEYRSQLADHLSDFLLPEGNAEQKAALRTELETSNKTFIDAMYTCLWKSPASYIQFFWQELYGHEESERIFNRPGTTEDNWEISLPDGKSKHWFWRTPVYQFQQDYWRQFSDTSRYASRPGDVGRGMNPPEVLLHALRNAPTDTAPVDPALIRKLEHYAQLLKKSEAKPSGLRARLMDIWNNGPWWR